MHSLLYYSQRVVSILHSLTHLTLLTIPKGRYRFLLEKSQAQKLVICLSSDNSRMTMARMTCSSLCVSLSWVGPPPVTSSLTLPIHRAQTPGSEDWPLNSPDLSAAHHPSHPTVLPSTYYRCGLSATPTELTRVPQGQERGLLQLSICST